MVKLTFLWRVSVQVVRLRVFHATLSKSQNKPLYSVAVEPAESPIITQTKNGESITPAPHKIQGIGANFIPKNLDLDLVDEVLPVNSTDAIEWAKSVQRKKGF